MSTSASPAVCSVRCNNSSRSSSNSGRICSLAIFRLRSPILRPYRKICRKPVPRLVPLRHHFNVRIAARSPRPSANSRRIFSPETSGCPEGLFHHSAGPPKPGFTSTTTIITALAEAGESGFPIVRSVGSGFTIRQSVECPVGLQFVAAAFAGQHRPRARRQGPRTRACRSPPDGESL